jgi:hypothetical protein
MKKALLVLAVLFSLSVQAQQHLDYPSYENVLHEFFDNYSARNLPSNFELKFEKRPEGWHVVVIEHLKDRQVTNKKALLWDVETKAFAEIRFDKVQEKGENAQMLERFLNSREREHFSFCPYFGYPSWDWDVIKAYENIQSLPDSTMYALARAYSSFAGNLLHNNSGLADLDSRFYLADGLNSMTKKQLAKYRLFRHRGIETFEKVAVMNPDFQTIVGSIGNKAANEHVTAYLDLCMFQNNEEAKKELPPGLYSKFHIATAKNYLNSCGQNAILFTQGDNDTYPLLYVQAQLGFRTDVLVVNLSLLNTERYINYLRNPVLDAAPLPISFTSDQLSGHQREIILIDLQDSSAIEVDAVVDIVKRNDNMLMIRNKAYHRIRTNKFQLRRDEEIIEWKVNDRYFSRSQLMVFDILSNNYWKRPICYATTVAPASFFGIQDHFQLEGFVYCLGSTKSEQRNSYFFGSTNTKVQLEVLLDKFDWTGIPTTTWLERWPSTHYLSISSTLAEALIAENNPKDARKILDKCAENFSNDVFPHGLHILPIVRGYYEIGRFSDGNDIARKVAYNLKNKVSSYKGDTMEAQQGRAEQTRKMLLDLLKQYNQTDLIEEFGLE